MTLESFCSSVEREVDPGLPYDSVIMRVDFPAANHHRKRIVRKGFCASLADAPELVVAKRFWEAVFSGRFRSVARYKGSLALHVLLAFRTPKRGREGWKATKPDLTNMAKTIEDALQAVGAVENDSRFAVVRLCKVFADEPGFAVCVTGLPSLPPP